MTTAKIDVGAYIEMDVYLPSLHSQARGMKLHGEGTVLRVESTDFAKRVAAEVFFEKEPEAAVLTASVVQ